MSAVAKSFSVGSILASLFIFTLTGIFTWLGNATISNSKQSIQTVVVLKNLNKTMRNLNIHLEKVDENFEEMNKRLYADEKDILRLGVKYGNRK